MYNRYIPQPDGSYRRRPADVPQSAPPPRPEPPRQEPPRRNPDFARRRTAGKAACQKNRPVPISAGRSVPLPHLRPGENRPSSRLRIPFWVSAIFCTSFCQRISAWKT